MICVELEFFPDFIIAVLHCVLCLQLTGPDELPEYLLRRQAHSDLKYLKSSWLDFLFSCQLQNKNIKECIRLCCLWSVYSRSGFWNVCFKVSVLSFAAIQPDEIRPYRYLKMRPPQSFNFLYLHRYKLLTGLGPLELHFQIHRVEDARIIWTSENRHKSTQHQ